MHSKPPGEERPGGEEGGATCPSLNWRPEPIIANLARSGRFSSCRQEPPVRALGSDASGHPMQERITVRETRSLQTADLSSVWIPSSLRENTFAGIEQVPSYIFSSMVSA